ncbi:FAD-binding oxidoreductase [Haloechinothrix alba]
MSMLRDRPVGDEAPATGYAAYDRAVAALRARYAEVPPGVPVRLDKPTSNLFRFRPDHSGDSLDVRGFGNVLEIDAAGRTAEVGGMTTYEDLVDATLPHGLMPSVVPQLKTITVGGAIAGLGIESTSLRNGLPHEAAQEMEILTGDGRVVRARPDNEHSALFHGFPNSYGTLGYVLRVRLALEPVRPAVLLRHLHFPDTPGYVSAMRTACEDGRYEGLPVDFVDGTVFSRGEHYLTLGSFTDATGELSDYTGARVFYRSLRGRATDTLSVHDYLWRWDTDWFWCSRALGAQNPLIRAVWPRRYLRSDVYRSIVAFDRRHGLSDRVRAARGAPPREPVIQDVEVPVDRVAEFLDFFHREIGISPIWVCPLRQRHPVRWTLYPLDPETLYVNVGFWSTVPAPDGAQHGTANRKIERAVVELGGHKSLYSTSFFDESEFWELYNGYDYGKLKRAYDPERRLPDLYEKCVRER